MKPNGYRLIRRGSDEATFCGGAASYRPFRITGQGVLGNGEAKSEELGAVAKANVRRQRGTGCARPESLPRDPKPVDLCVARLKPSESWVEDRTGADVQIVRMSCV